jgi:hypothetical protein
MDEPVAKRVRMNIDNSDAVNLTKIGILPREILCIIFSHLDKKSVRNATASCKLWFELIRSDSELSGYICLEKFGLKQLFIKILDGEWKWERWPVLKTLKLGGLSAFQYSKQKTAYLTKLVDFKACPTLEKVVISVSCTMIDIFPDYPNLPVGIIEELTFDPKIDIESFRIEHVSKLKISVDLMEWFSKRIPGNDNSGVPEYANITVQILKLLGETPHNLKDITLVSRNVGLTHLNYSRQLKNSFEQMFKVLEDRLQTVYLIAGHISCIDPLLSDSTPITEIWIETTSMYEIGRSYRRPFQLEEKLTGLFQRFKKLRKCRIDLELSEEEEDQNCDTWPEFVKREFQDSADFKFRFVYSKQIVGSVKDEQIQVLRRPRQSHRYKRAIRFEITHR